MSANNSSPVPSGNSRPAAKSPAARKRTPGVIGAVVGAVVGGVLGAVLVKKARNGGAKRLVPAKVPVVGKRVLSAVKSVARDAKVVAKATAGLAADAALSQVKSAAQQFMVEAAQGQAPSPPHLEAPAAPAQPAEPTSAASSQPRKKSAPRKKTARTKPAAKTKVRPATAKAARPRGKPAA